jgi:DNA ligase-4
VGPNHVSVERKYDGEYCQIHINTRNAIAPIKIFSKSGRDSTDDRAGIHDAIRESLAIGTTKCKFTHHCILEGELLVWNDDKKQIEPFYKIRKYVSRSGHFLGSTADSPVAPTEWLMIMFYDLLLLDDIICLKEPHDKRRQRLWSAVRCIPGRAGIGTREKIIFDL